MKSNYTPWLVISVLLVSCTKQYDTIYNAKTYDKTVVVYMIANNSLNANVDRNINQMEWAWNDTTKHNNLVVYVDRKTKYSGTNNPYILKIKHDDDWLSIRSPIQRIYNNHNSASADIVQQVLQDIQKLYPSNSYSLIFWSHATGWLPPNYSTSININNQTLATINHPTNETIYRPILKSFGDNYGTKMSVTDLANAIPFHCEFIWFDACLMGNIETCFEFKDKADYIVAYPTEVLGEGAPYHKIIPSIFQGQEGIIHASKVFFDYYNSKNLAVEQSASIGVIKTNQLDELANFLKIRFAMYPISADTIQYLSVDIPNVFYDLGHVLQSSLDQEDYIQAEVILNKVIIYKLSTPYFFKGLPEALELKHFSGLSIFVPTHFALLNSAYVTLSWNKQSNWLNFFTNIKN